jgi:hypothetical protein
MWHGVRWCGNSETEPDHPRMTLPDTMWEVVAEQMKELRIRDLRGQAKAGK